MSDSVLVQVASGLATALEIERDAGNFELGDFDVDWDWEGRVEDQDLTDNDLHVRVVVPRRYDEVTRFARDSLQYTATYDIDIRQKLGVSHQNTRQEIDKEELKPLSRLVEQIHEYFFSSPRPIDSIDAEWIDERDEVPKKSEILIAYSVKYLREQRQFYGVCREVFQVTV